MNRGFTVVVILLVAGLTVLAIGGGYFGYDSYVLSQVDDYESCAEARGSLIMESYPEQCRARNGATFTRILTPEEEDRLNPPQTVTENGTTQAVPAPGFEDVPEMIVGEGVDDSEPEFAPSQEGERVKAEEPSVLPLLPIAERVEWINGFDGWQPSGTPPACPDPPLLQTPVDLSRVISILYPGQYRGGNYKPHGGFRFDKSSSGGITLRAPMDAYVVAGTRLLVDGQLQYTFDFISECGIWYRFGHISGASPKFVAIADAFPPPVEGDSSTHEVFPQVEVVAGEIIATVDSPQGLDWGVYDLRSKNTASQDPAWAALHTGQQAQNAVCWFDLLSPEDEAIIRSLPPTDGVSGSMSDYCL